MTVNRYLAGELRAGHRGGHRVRSARHRPDPGPPRRPLSAKRPESARHRGPRRPHPDARRRHGARRPHPRRPRRVVPQPLGALVLGRRPAGGTAARDARRRVAGHGAERAGRGARGPHVRPVGGRDAPVRTRLRPRYGGLLRPRGDPRGPQLQRPLRRGFRTGRSGAAGERARTRPPAAAAAGARASWAVVGHLPGFFRWGRGGTMSRTAIMPMSSWLRMWQCRTVLPVKCVKWTRMTLDPRLGTFTVS